MSYYPYDYYSFHKKGEKNKIDYSIRGYASIDLRKFDKNWISGRDTWFIEEHLWKIPYKKFFPRHGRSEFYVYESYDKIKDC